jgi:predicted DCC family thiol-disulfide oxidoreductase YuxK
MKALIVFDTDCVLCSRMVRFVLAHENSPFFAFVGAWSPAGLKLAARYGFTRENLDETVLVVIDGVAYHHSDAAIEILRRMRQPWALLSTLRFVPRFLRDPAYSAVARRRYRWFGHKRGCFVPPPEQRARFLDLSGFSDYAANPASAEAARTP